MSTPLALLVTLAAILPGSGSQVFIALAGFLLGVLACALQAVIEYGAWALVLPPRSRQEPPCIPPSQVGTVISLPPAKGGLEEATISLPPAKGESEEATISLPLAKGATVGNRPSTTEDRQKRAQPISVRADDGARLAGLWYPAAAVEPTGATAILVHGFAEPSSGLRAQRQEALNQAGWNVAALDLRGYGASEGPYSSFGGREAGDVRTWIDFLAKRVGPPVDCVPILWGRSMGAAIAIRAAALDSRIRALILESPMVSLDDAMAVWFRRRRAPFPGLLARLVTRRAGRLAGVSLTRPRPLELAPQVRCPVLIVHGAEDMLVTIRDARRLAAVFPNPAPIVEVPGAGHTDVIAIGGEPVLKQLVQFLRDSVK